MTSRWRASIKDGGRALLTVRSGQIHDRVFPSVQLSATSIARTACWYKPGQPTDVSFVPGDLGIGTAQGTMSLSHLEAEYRVLYRE
jgi:hypothetical protein